MKKMPQLGIKLYRAFDSNLVSIEKCMSAVPYQSCCQISCCQIDELSMVLSFGDIDLFKNYRVYG
jgi:hypothetical protein